MTPSQLPRLALLVLLMTGTGLACSFTKSNDDDDDDVTTPDDDDTTPTDDDDDTVEPPCGGECPGTKICKNDECVEPVYPELREFATETVSIDPTGENILINGRMIRPPTVGLTVGTFPTNVEISPDGQMVVVNENGFGTKGDGGKKHVLRVIDPATMTITQEFIMPNRTMYWGMRFNASGTLFFLAGGNDDRVHVFIVNADHTLQAADDILIEGCYTAGLEFNAAGDVMYVTCTPDGWVYAIDLTAGPDYGSVIWKSEKTTRPYTLWLNPAGTHLFVTNWGTTYRPEADTITVLNAASGALVKTIPVGLAPEGLIPNLDGTKLYSVANKSDNIFEIDVASMSVLREIKLYDEDKVKGLGLTMGALSPDGTTLYVTSTFENCVIVVDVASGTVKGKIPAEWYADDVAVSPDGTTLFVANGKGKGDGSNKGGDTVGRQMFGSVNKIAVPDASTLAGYTDIVNENNRRQQDYFDLSQGNDTPVPSHVGEKESPIKHVFIIMKENLSHDSVFGDMEIGRGDPDLLMWGEDVVPNTRKLAREFTMFDAFFCDSEGSVDGHQWALGTIDPDYVQKGWVLNYANFGFPYVTVGVDFGSQPEGEMFLPHLLKHGVSVRSFGVAESFGANLNSPQYKDYISPTYPLIYMTGVKDRDKADIFIAEFEDLIESDSLPSLIFILLPNDHGEGISIGVETPTSMIADNDEGFGKVVQAISQSRVWGESVIFMFEDDTQSGYDHIDAHRGPALAIGPWIKRGYVSSVTYSYPNVHKTAELILGAPPASQFDKLASGMYDIFVAKPDLTPYEMAPRTYPEEVYQGASNALTEMSAKINWSAPDQAASVQAELYWRFRKGTEPPKLKHSQGDGD